MTMLWTWSWAPYSPCCCRSVDTPVGVCGTIPGPCSPPGPRCRGHRSSTLHVAHPRVCPRPEERLHHRYLPCALRHSLHSHEERRVLARPLDVEGGMTAQEEAPLVHITAVRYHGREHLLVLGAFAWLCGRRRRLTRPLEAHPVAQPARALSYA